MSIERLANLIQAFESDLNDSLEFLRGIEYKDTEEAIAFTTVISTLEALDRASQAAGSMISTMAMILSLCDPGPNGSPAHVFMQKCLEDDELAPQIVLIQSLIIDCINLGGE